MFFTIFYNNYIICGLFILHAALLGECDDDDLLTRTTSHITRSVEDISKSCKSQKTLSLMMAYGSGIGDARVMVLAADDSSSEALPELCSLHVAFEPSILNQTKDIYNLIVVVEIFNTQKFQDFCSTQGSNVIVSLGIENKILINICRDHYRYADKLWKKSQKAAIYLGERSVRIAKVLELQPSFLLGFRLKKLKGIVKINLTVARVVEDHDDCDDRTPHDVFCKIGSSLYCVNPALTCDGVPNCGFYELYDEEFRICQVSTHDVQMGLNLVIISFVCSYIMIFTIYASARRITLNRNYFVFQESDMDFKEKIMASTAASSSPDSFLLKAKTESDRQLDVIHKINRSTNKSDTILAVPENRGLVPR